MSNRRRLGTGRTSPPPPNSPSGFNGRENAYRCRDCGGLTVTIDVDDGVTPMFLACRASGREGDCPGTAGSMMYPQGPRPAHIPEPAWEWFRPRTVQGLDAETRDHVQRGGLLLRRRQ